MRRRGFLGLAMATGIAAVTGGCVEISPLASTGDFPVAASVNTTSPTVRRMTTRDQGRGQIIIGVKNDQPGLGYQNPDTGAYSGFDIEIAELVAGGLGFAGHQIQFVAVESLNREIAIENGSVDLVVASYSYLRSRAELVDFAGPYFKTTTGILVRKDASTTGLGSFTANQTVCTAEGSTSTDVTKLSRAQVVLRGSYSECVSDLSAGKVDGVYTDLAVLAGYAAQDPSHLRAIPVEDSSIAVQYYGIGLPLNDSILQGQINAILQTAESNGTWAEIFNATLAQSHIQSTPPPIGVWPNG